MLERLQATELCAHAAEYRQRGLPDVAILFAQRGLLGGCDPVRVKAEIATSGFHSKRPYMRALGARLCEELTLDREFPEAAREVTWRNLFRYRKKLGDLAPSLQRWLPIRFEPPAGFYPMNPSIVNGPDGVIMNVRCVNYLIGTKNHGPTITRNFLFHVEPSLEHSCLGELDVSDVPIVSREVVGLEDLRLWYLDGNLCASATSRQHNDERLCEMTVVSIEGGKATNFTVLQQPPGPKRHQKNWMPVSDGSGRFVYSCDPTVVCGYGPSPAPGEIGVPPVSARHWRGSSQLIPFDDGFLAIIHECPRDLDPVLCKPPYRQRFVWFDRELQISTFSLGWEFGHDSAGEYVCGMCEHPDGKRLVISYGVLDREAWLATVSKDDVRAILKSPPSGTAEAFNV